MRQGNDITDFEFAMLPSLNSVHIDREFFIADNLCEPIKEEYNPRTQLGARLNHPMKLTFSCVLMCKSGAISIKVNLRETTVKENQILTLVPGTICELLSISNDWRAAILSFADISFLTHLDVLGAIEIGRHIKADPCIPVTAEDMEEVLSIYQILSKRISRPSFKQKSKLVYTFIQMLIVYWESWVEHNRELEEPNNLRQKTLLDRFLIAVSKNYQQQRAISFYASELCITPKYLSKVCKDVSGKHASEWIKEMVILEAKALLKSQQYTVQEVSEELNFVSPSSFGRYFKDATGKTPRQYQVS